MIPNSHFYDASFNETTGLTWLPWIGINYPAQPVQNRIMIVGESHYTNKKDEAEARRVIDDHHKNKPTYTREVMHEIGMGIDDWGNSTFANLHRALFKTAPPDRNALWADIACYNLVQRMLWYEKPGGPERPTKQDFWEGWRVFAKVIQIVQPSHCLFIGVAASNHFNKVMPTLGLEFSPVTWTEQVGRTWGRRGRLTISSHTTQIHAIHHCGKHFSPQRWNAYLHRQSPEFMSLLSNPDYLHKA
jgi:hypothetical protein